MGTVGSSVCGELGPINLDGTSGSPQILQNQSQTCELPFNVEHGRLALK
jgi:hypothetical protein